MSKSVLNKKMVEMIEKWLRKEVIKFSRKYTVYRLGMR